MSTSIRMGWHRLAGFFQTFHNVLGKAAHEALREQLTFQAVVTINTREEVAGLRARRSLTPFLGP
jgi:hypothetical protein